MKIISKINFLSIFFFLSIFLVSNCYSQEKVKIYDPTANASEQIKKAVNSAQQQHKNILIQIGGNWCPWCLKLHHFIQDHQELDSIIKADYVFIRINYSKENKNPRVMQQLQYPQRFGFPVLVVLDQHGKLLHTQDTGYLEKGDSYDEANIKRFLTLWNIKALNPDTYKSKN